MTEVTIYHNPRCSKSRETLALIEGRGLAPKVIHYLDSPPTEPALRDLLRRLGLTARDLVRRKEPLFAQLGLLEKLADDDALVRAMVANPILIERPIVVVGERARIGRPPENVLEILPSR
jgi:arsenate reductase